MRRAWCVAASTSALPIPSPHRSGSTKQTVEFAADHRREARDLAVRFGDDHLPVRDLRQRKVNRLGIGNQLVAIFGKLERGVALQFLELVALLGPRHPQRQGVSEL
ncbi:MAG TPA: hypothetical protein VFK19_09210 [Sphingomicrobium sp.]|nr:hypothetical protein [Sphingomicrobium sp.]